jgi:glycosyltransferase involved in cell wall biosynthesis
MKQVLFITYFWPPSGKATLHWPLKMIQHLPGFGWQPLVLTADEDTFSSQDESLLKEVDPDLKVFKARVVEPFGLYRRLLGKEKNAPLTASETISTTNRGLRHRLAIWIRMNLFIPDARIGWYWNAVLKGKQILRSEDIQAIVSIGPPHTTLLVGKKLSKEFGIPHIPVFIDPWVDIAYYREFKRSRFTKAIDSHLEQSVLKQASKAIFVTQSMKEDYLKKYVWLKNKSEVLYWGYNEEAFQNYHSSVKKGAEILLHAGNIFDYQNPQILWKTIRQEINRGRKLRLKFIGTVSPGIKRAIEENNLADWTDYAGFLPYNKVIEEMLNATYLLVCPTEKRHIPGKLFEYLRTGNKIIVFGDENNEVENILRKANAGKIFSYSYDTTDIFQQLSSCSPNPEIAKQFSREVIAKELAEILG